MADISDVATTLAGIVSSVLYPNGTQQPPLNDVPAKIYYGWPIPEQLTADIKAGTCHVSIYPTPTERNTTRYPLQWQQESINTPTLTAQIAGNVLGARRQRTGRREPAERPPVVVNRQPYVYAVQPTDTLATIASAFAVTIGASVPGTVAVAGPQVDVSGAGDMLNTASVGVTGTSLMEIGRQQRPDPGFTVWAYSPSARDAIIKAVDPAMALLFFITLPDGSAARMIYHGSPQTDRVEKQQIYRRDLIYSIEYATTVSETESQILVEQIDIQPLVSGLAETAIATTYVYGRPGLTTIQTTHVQLDFRVAHNSMYWAGVMV